MFSNNEQLIIGSLRKTPDLSLAEIATACGLARSSAHVAIQTLLELGVLVDSKTPTSRNSKYRVASQEVIAEVGKRLIAEFYAEVGTEVESAKPRLVFTDSYVLPERYLQRLRNKYEITTFEKSPTFMTDELFSLRSQNADIVVRFDFPTIDASYLANAPDVKAIFCPNCVVSGVDLAECEKRNVRVLNFDIRSQKYYTTTQVEYTLQALMTLMRPIWRGATSVAKGGTYNFRDHLGPELNGSRIGLIFTNSNVSAFSSTFRSLGCEVAASSTTATPPSPLHSGVNEYVDVQELWTWADAVIILEGRDFDLDPLLKGHKNPNYIINISGGTRYSLEIMRERILSLDILGLALDYLPAMDTGASATDIRLYDTDLQDTFRQLVNLPNVLMTPEMSVLSTDSLDRSYQQAFEILMSLELA